MIKFLLEDLKAIVEGRKALPVGTVRSRNGRDYVKTKTGWTYVPSRNRKSKKGAQAHYSKTGKVPHGFAVGDDGVSVKRKKNPRALSGAKKAKQSGTLKSSDGYLKAKRKAMKKARLKSQKIDRRSKGHKDLMSFVKKVMPGK